MYVKKRKWAANDSIFFTGGLSAPDEAEDELGRVQAQLGAAECLGKIANCITNFIFDRAIRSAGGLPCRLSSRRRPRRSS
jgi:hypothetical protein